MVALTPMEDRSAYEKRVGTTLRGKWRLEKLLGVGGMAAVYVGVHHIGRREAIKILHPEVARVKDLRERFEQEARAVNVFQHPGVVEIRDIDVTEEGAPFLVMELLEGESLSERARRLNGLPLDELLRYADELLDVLGAAHARGIVHRDIKLDNLFVESDGHLKVLDFGIARMRVMGGRAGLTRTGAALGTTAYMPPEQARGAEIDHRADLFAVGATMYRIIAKRRIHEAKTDQEMLAKMATEPAQALASVAPAAPRDVCLVVDRALAFDRDRRYPDAATMQADVRALRAGQPPPWATARHAAGDVPSTRPPAPAHGAHPSAAAFAIEPTALPSDAAAPRPGATDATVAHRAPGGHPAPVAPMAVDPTVAGTRAPVDATAARTHAAAHAFAPAATRAEQAGSPPPQPSTPGSASPFGASPTAAPRPTHAAHAQPAPHGATPPPAHAVAPAPAMYGAAQAAMHASATAPHAQQHGLARHPAQGHAAGAAPHAAHAHPGAYPPAPQAPASPGHAGAHAAFAPSHTATPQSTAAPQSALHTYGQTPHPVHAAPAAHAHAAQAAAHATHAGNAAHASSAHGSYRPPPTSDHPPASVARSDPPPSAAWHQNLGGAAPSQRPGPVATTGSGQYPQVPAAGITTGSGQYPQVPSAGITTGNGQYPQVPAVGITTGSGQPSPFVTTHSGQISPVAPAPRKKPSALPVLAIAGAGLLFVALAIGGLFMAFSGEESSAASAPAKDNGDTISPSIPADAGARPAVAQPKKPGTPSGTTSPALAPTGAAPGTPAAPAAAGDGNAAPAPPPATPTQAAPTATPPRDNPPPAPSPPRPGKGNEKDKQKGPKDK
jgi:serine/threonine-protein kinase